MNSEEKFAPMSKKSQARKKVSKKKKRVKHTGRSEAAVTKMIKSLAMKTEMSEESLRQQYTSFMGICPDGSMSKRKFIELAEGGRRINEKKLMGEEAEFLADSLFRVFDDDKSGSMDFPEYIMALNATRINSPEDKLKWIFNVFDRDGGGTIDNDEISSMVTGLFAMSQIDISEEEIKDCCEDVMGSIDVDGDGEITRQEFIEHAMNSKFIYNMLCG